MVELAGRQAFMGGWGTAVVTEGGRSQWDGVEGCDGELIN